jgi:sugar phosphate isomerase/epimerase
MSMPTETFTRRRLLVRSAQAAGILAGGLPWAPLLAGQGARGFKIGACDWSLDKRCDPEAFDVARQIGLDGVQVDLGSPRNQMRLRRPEVQAEFVKAAKRTGLEIAALAVVETNDVPLKSDPRAAGWLADAVDVCQGLGVQIVMPACFGAGNLDMSKTAEIDQLVRVLKGVAAKAEKRGVLIGVESYLSAEENRRLLDRVGSPAVKVYYDVGNSTDKGRDVCKEIRALGDAICQFHFKDGDYMLGQGRIDFKRVRKAMDDIHYRGWIQIEAATPHGLIADYTADRKYLKELFPRTVSG